MIAMDRIPKTISRFLSRGFKAPARFHSSPGSERGFTLIELLIVVAIIAILVAVAVPQYFRFVQKAREVGAVSFIKDVMKAEEIYNLELEDNTYTNSFEALEATNAIPDETGSNVRVREGYTFTLTAGTNASGKSFWTITAEPNDDDPQNRYYFADNSGRIRYEVGSAATASSPIL